MNVQEPGPPGDVYQNEHVGVMSHTTIRNRNKYWEECEPAKKTGMRALTWTQGSEQTGALWGYTLAEPWENL